MENTSHMKFARVAFIILLAMTLLGTQGGYAQDVPPPMIGVIFANNSGVGLRVERVLRDSPADVANLQAGDVIVAINGVILTETNVGGILTFYGPGDLIILDILRTDQTYSVELILSRRPEDPRELSPNILEALAIIEAPHPRPRLGVTLDTFTVESGVQVFEILERGPAARAGIRPGDRIIAVEGERAFNPTQLDQLLSQYAPKQLIRVQIERNGVELAMFVRLGIQPNTDTPPQISPPPEKVI